MRALYTAHTGTHMVLCTIARNAHGTKHNSQHNADYTAPFFTLLCADMALAVNAATVLPSERFAAGLSSQGNAVLLFQARLESVLSATSTAPAPAAGAGKKVPYVMGVQRSMAQGGGMWFSGHFCVFSSLS
jgi:hypothetical protein